jgi:hypothetical protein
MSAALKAAVLPSVTLWVGTGSFAAGGLFGFTVNVAALLVTLPPYSLLVIITV